ncbi:MAG TPA: hypothetical protein VHN59_01395 [Chitinophagaceae bacterium]|nr:hypothetical protein [Chitinophagaceae bacterium]
MKRLLFLIFAGITFTAFAQKENFDVMSFTPVRDWKMERSENTLSLTGVDETKGTFCIITLYKSLNGSADSKTNFGSAWQKLVQKNFGAGKPKMEAPGKENGWELQSGSAKFEKSGTTGLVTLITATANSKMANMIILTNSDAYTPQINSFVASIELQKKPGTAANTATSPTEQPQNGRADNLQSNNHSIPGVYIYNETMSSPTFYAYTRMALCRGYRFNADGTYSYFNNMYLRGNPKLTFSWETGTYTVNGNQLTVKPLKGQNEEWSKKGEDGSGEEKFFGKRLSITTRKLETVTYTFEKKTLPGDNKTIHLLLKYDKETIRDAGYTYDKNAKLWRYGPYEPDAYHIPPGFKF